MSYPKASHGVAHGTSRGEFTLLQHGKQLLDVRKNFQPNVDLTPTHSPKARLEIVRAYFNLLIDSYLREIQAEVTRQTPMASSARLAVCVPVAMVSEAQNISQLLRNYEGQTLGKDQFEIILLLNHPANLDSAASTKAQNTLLAVQEYQRSSKLRIVASVHEFDSRTCGIGYLRKRLHDIALMRHANRPSASDSELWMVVNDADTVATNPRYLENYLHQIDRNPKLDFIVGRHRFDRSMIATDENLLFLLEAWERLESRLYGSVRDYCTSNPNFAIAAGSYALAIGFDARVSGCECYYIQRNIQAIRLAQGVSQERVSINGGLDSRIYTSSRRLLAAARMGFKPWQQWSNKATAFGTSAEDARNSASIQPQGTKLDIATIVGGVYSLVDSICTGGNFLFNGRLIQMPINHPDIALTLAKLGAVVEPLQHHSAEVRSYADICKVSFDETKLSRVVASLRARAASEMTRFSGLVRFSHRPVTAPVS